MKETNDRQTKTTALLVCALWMATSVFANHANAEPVGAPGAGIEISAEDFTCLNDMTRVRHFFVDNILDDLDGTLEVAHSPSGGIYPPGSVVQLVPTEVMVKHKPGWNAATRDWEFFELDVAEGTTTIEKRGFVDVVNRFGGNCFTCHVRARPEWDLICEQGHGCETIPITREQIAEIQKADPRCT